MSTRRGGLGRGLGALIQSTAAVEESEVSQPPAPAQEQSGAERRQRNARRTTSAAEAAVAANDADAAQSKASSTADSEKSAPAKKKTAGKTTAKSTGTSKRSQAGKTGTKDADKDAAATPAGARDTADGPAVDGDADTTTPAKKKTVATKDAPTQDAAGDSADAPASSTRGTKTASATTKATKKTGAAASRPADIFFAPSASADGEGEASETGESGRRGNRPSRPSMPTVKAPSKRAAAGRSAEPAEPTQVSTDIAVLREIPVGDIHPNPRQPREVFDEDHMAELVTSIQEVGILQPIVVREVADGSTPYELIMGERRWRATQRAGLDTIPAIVRQTPDQDLLRDALLENLHRSQLNPLEEAAAYQQLMEDFACTQEELSQRIGRSRPQISNTMRLLRLPPLVQRRVAAGALSAGHARALLGLTDPAEMERLAQRVVSEGLSVRATEDAVAQLQGAVRPAPKARRGRDESTRHERLDYFATALTSRLDTQVKITLGARKGKIAIDFASVEDLNRIMDLIQGGQSQDDDGARHTK